MECAIRSVELDGVALSPSQYRVEAGQITLTGSLFVSAKPNVMTVRAAGYKNVYATNSVTQGSSKNLALNKLTTTSEKPLQSSNFAVDGNNNTRWESAFSDLQWITVDLGEVTSIKRVVLNWENAAAKAYSVEVSTDGKTWTTVYSTTNGHEGLENLFINPTEARYVKVNCTKRTTQYGYSLFDLEVY